MGPKYPSAVVAMLPVIGFYILGHLDPLLILSAPRIRVGSVGHVCGIARLGARHECRPRWALEERTRARFGNRGQPEVVGAREMG